MEEEDGFASPKKEAPDVLSIVLSMATSMATYLRPLRPPT